MKIIDTHSHVFAEEFDQDFEQMITRATDAGIAQIIMPNINITTIDRMHNAQQRFPELLHSAMGLHPSAVGADWEKQLAVIKKNLFENPIKYAAVGEIGIDLYWDKTFRNEQVEVFTTQIDWAKGLGLPIIIHVRDAFDEVFKVVAQKNDHRLTGVFHCFTGTVEQGEWIQNLGGFYLGIGGVVTFKNAGVDKAVAKLDLQKMVVETDAPYLAPTPNRGKRNEPAFIMQVVSRLAELFGKTKEEVAKITGKNAQNLFNL